MNAIQTRIEAVPMAEDIRDYSLLHVKAKTEMVEHPKHYASTNAPCECIEVIHYVTEDLPGDVAVGVGNTEKYLWRLGKKAPDTDNGQTVEEKILEDMKKAKWYLCDAIKQMENRMNEKEKRGE